MPNIGRRLCVVSVVDWTSLNALSGQYALNMQYSIYLFAVSVVIAVLLAYYDLHRFHLHHYSRVEGSNVHQSTHLITGHLIGGILKG